MIQISSVPHNEIRYRNSCLRRHSVIPVEITFVQAIPFPVSTLKTRQNKSLVEIFIDEGMAA